VVNDSQGEHAGLVAALQRATHATLHSLATTLADLGLSGSEQNVLAQLAGNRVLSISELAAASGTRPSTLTSVLDRLERSGELVRELDRSDRRSFLVRLTPQGRRTAAAVQAAITGLERAALAGLTRQQLAGFFAVTDALTESSR
jgi:MarR family transcriptional regulator, organic hydroperoxide resistance regulator